MHFTISLRAEDFLIQKLKTVFSPLYSLMVLAISGSATDVLRKLIQITSLGLWKSK